jgi:hypothetical protein
MAEKGYKTWPSHPIAQENMMAEFMRDLFERGKKGEL